MKKIISATILVISSFAFSQCEKSFEIQPINLGSVLNPQGNTKYVTVIISETYETNATAKVIFKNESCEQSASPIDIPFDTDIKDGDTISDYDKWRYGFAGMPSRSLTLLKAMGLSYIQNKYGITLIVVEWYT